MGIFPSPNLTDIVAAIRKRIRAILVYSRLGLMFTGGNSFIENGRNIGKQAPSLSFNANKFTILLAACANTSMGRFAHSCLKT